MDKQKYTSIRVRENTKQKIEENIKSMQSKDRHITRIDYIDYLLMINEKYEMLKEMGIVPDTN